MSFIKKHWGKLLTLGALIGGTIYLIRRNRDESQSEFAGGSTKTIQFTLNNTSGSDQQVDLFKARTIGISNDRVSITPSMGTFNMSLLSEPKKVLGITINTTPNQANQPITKMCVDASGESAGDAYYPQVGANQAQPGIVTVQPDNLILDGTCYLGYTVAANTRVSMVVTYAVLGKPGARRKKKKK